MIAAFLAAALAGFCFIQVFEYRYFELAIPGVLFSFLSVLLAANAHSG